MIGATLSLAACADRDLLHRPPDNPSPADPGPEPLDAVLRPDPFPVRTVHPGRPITFRWKQEDRPCGRPSHSFPNLVAQDTRQNPLATPRPVSQPGGGLPAHRRRTSRLGSCNSRKGRRPSDPSAPSACFRPVFLVAQRSAGKFQEEVEKPVPNSRVMRIRFGAFLEDASSNGMAIDAGLSQPARQSRKVMRQAETPLEQRDRLPTCPQALQKRKGGPKAGPVSKIPSLNAWRTGSSCVLSPGRISSAPRHGCRG